MANIVITSTTNTVKVDFGAYSTSLDGQEAGCYQKKDIEFYKFSDRVRCIVKGEKEWSVAYTSTTGCFIIDSIDGASPSSNTDLYDKLIATLRGSLVSIASASVTCNATDTSLVGANEQRKGLSIVNTGSNAIFLGISEAAVLNKGIYLVSGGGAWVMDEFTFTKGAINGITTTSTSNVSIQEFE